MKWRKWNRWIHRELGYFFFGMAIIYGISGIALNHHIARHWTPSYIEKSSPIEGILPSSSANADKDYVENILKITGERDNYKQYYFPNENTLFIYLKNGHISVNLNSGESYIVKVRNRRVFRELNFLHYNKPKKLWTYFADMFAFSMIILAFSGILMVRGKKGLKGRGAISVTIGIVIPLAFLVIYLWA